MADEVDLLMDQFDRGRLNRRELLTGLAFATGGALVGRTREVQAAQAPAPIVPVASINHVNASVSDRARSADFYSTVFGATFGPRKSGTMNFPGGRPGYGCWVSLVAGGEPRPQFDHSDGKPGVYTHMGIGTTVPSSEFPRLAMEVEKRFPALDMPTLPVTPREVAGREIYIFDPDGAAMQIIAVGFQAL